MGRPAAGRLLNLTRTTHTPHHCARARHARSPASSAASVRPFSSSTLVMPLREATYEREMSKRLRAKVGRNEPCPCGSGKKFKKCCGFASELH